MPFSQKIDMELELKQIADMMKQIKEFNTKESKPEPGDDLKTTSLTEPSADQQLPSEQRSMLGDRNTTVTMSQISLNLPYIDTDDDVIELQETEEERSVADTEQSLQDAASHMRSLRWRAASRKLQRSRSRLKNEVAPESKSGSSGDESEYMPRLRGLLVAGRISVSSCELLNLTLPPPAATAPSSPYFLTPSLADQSSSEYFGSSPECYADTMLDCKIPRAPAPPPGPRYVLATQASLRVCSFQHSQKIVDKILSAKFLKKWEMHVFTLLDDRLICKTPSILLEDPLFFTKMQAVFCIARWDTAGKYCVRIIIATGSTILQANDAYTRDQWYHSIIWRTNMIRFRSAFSNVESKKKDYIMKELKDMVDYVMTTPLQDECVTKAPMEILTNLLKQNVDSPEWEEWANQAISTAAPLIAERCTNEELCGLFARLCKSCPRVSPLPALAPPVRRVLNRNGDFTRAPNSRRLVVNYISALSGHNAGATLVRRFVEVTHGPCATCPHPRAAANLASVALAALDEYYREPNTPHICHQREERVLCFADILVIMCEYEDWLEVVSAVLQPVPFCANAMQCPKVARRLAHVMMKMAGDPRCAVHSCLMAPRTARPNPPAWLTVASPSQQILGFSKPELCLLLGNMLECLLKCCSKKKSFFQSMSKTLPDFLLIALTMHPAAIESLCLILEWEVVDEEQTKLDIITALQATDLGQKCYLDLCERQKHMETLQAEGGPRIVALPLRATDADVADLLKKGALGNLESLSLAFTSVTSDCAQYLIKLPSLRYLNLWSTKFGDRGIQLIAGHLPRLQALNLCETPITDEGIEALSSLVSLTRLNLNSTKLSAETFEALKQKLTHLREIDIRYTDAW